MPTRAIDLLNHGESAVCVFNHGDFFQPEEGTTGYWHINPEAVDEVDKVIVYFRDGDRNRIYIGDYSGIYPAPTNWPDRYIIKATKFMEIDITASNWLGFGNGSQNPAQIIRNM